MLRYSRVCLLFLSFGLLVFFSCEENKPVQFPVDFDIESSLFAKSRAAQEGRLDFSKPQKLEYNFPDTFVFPPDSSLVFEYDFGILPSQTIRENFSLVLNMGEVFWKLPLDDYGIHYAVPVDDSFSGSFSVTLEGTGKIEKDEAPVFQIHSLRLNERWFGFNRNTDKYSYYTPFVYRRDDNSYVIDVPPSFMPHGRPVEIYAVFSGSGALEFNGCRIEAFPDTKTFYIPPPLYSSSGQVILSGEGIGVFYLDTPREPLVFPKPLEADPALVIVWPQEKWRNSGYEVFRWEHFPSLLILDFANYAIQDRMLKRLAFFVEKAGFRGRLAADQEIATLHGWNAHDYRAEDLARFFDTARRTNFSLLDEERELEKILLNEGIIREEQGDIAAGTGGIISISKESSDYLRYRFMAHEGFHGLYFIDEKFRDFSRGRWERFSPAAKRFLVSFFGYQQYDTNDEYLMINEFMAHILQQPVSQAATYFGRALPQLLESTWRVSSLPPKDAATGTWPSLAAAFTEEAEAFSAYVNTRWGLAAGRVWSVSFTKLP